MKDQRSYISSLRDPIDTPLDLVENGECHFGTFKDPFKKMSLLDVKKPCGKMPSFLRKTRFTEWEAFEINMKDGAFVSAIYKTSTLCFNLVVFYDKNENKVYEFQDFGRRSKCHLASSLVDTVSSFKTKHSEIIIENNFERGECKAKCISKNKKFGQIEYEFEATRVSPPSIASMALGKPNPIYSEKDLFKAKGYIKINGKTYTSDDESTAIVDDHKGYYPYKAHYDWLTTMGKLNIDGEKKFIGFNLTHNQSIDEANYNENLLWLEGESYPLPPVTFKHLDKDTWEVKDDYDDVNLVFRINKFYKMMVHLGIIDITYRLPFGVIHGYVKDANGKKYILDGFTGLAEDRSQRM